MENFGSAGVIVTLHGTNNRSWFSNWSNLQACPTCITFCVKTKNVTAEKGTLMQGSWFIPTIEVSQVQCCFSSSCDSLSKQKQQTHKKPHSTKLAPWPTPPQSNLTPEIKFYSCILNLLIPGDYNEHTHTPLNHGRTPSISLIYYSHEPATPVWLWWRSH